MRFRPDFQSLYGIHDSTERIQFTEAFLDAKNIDDYKTLNNKYPCIFGEYAQGQSAEDIMSVCDMMRKANEMFALTQSTGDISVNDLLAVGLSPVFLGVGKFDDKTEEIQASSFMLSYLQRVNGINYGNWLSRAADKVEQRFPGQHLAMVYSGGYLSDDADMRPTSDYDKLRIDCSYILQQLFSLHLADVATICDDNPVRQVQMAYSGISCLWLGLVERMSGGRAGRCEACGKPFVAYGERRKQKFCCSQCRKWKNKHPNEMRGYWYYEQR